MDIAPTIYELAGIEIERNEYSVDGISFVKYLLNEKSVSVNDDGRDTLLFEYIWVSNITMAHYRVWYPSNVSYMGQNVVPSCCNEMGQLYWVDKFTCVVSDH